MAGYSKRSLVEKLGVKPGHRVYIGNSPEGYLKTLGPLPEKAILTKSLKGTCDFIQFFSKERAELESEFPRVMKSPAVDVDLWSVVPKGASKLKTSLNVIVAREIGLKNGVLDVKVSAVDDVWSGLKFVFRLKDR